MSPQDVELVLLVARRKGTYPFITASMENHLVRATRKGYKPRIIDVTWDVEPMKTKRPVEEFVQLTTTKARRILELLEDCAGTAQIYVRLKTQLDKFEAQFTAPDEHETNAI